MVDPVLVGVISELLKTNQAQNELILRYATALTRGQVVGSTALPPLPKEFFNASDKLGTTGAALDRPIEDALDITPELGKDDVWSDTGP